MKKKVSILFFRIGCYFIKLSGRATRPEAKLLLIIESLIKYKSRELGELFANNKSEDDELLKLSNTISDELIVLFEVRRQLRNINPNKLLKGKYYGEV